MLCRVKQCLKACKKYTLCLTKGLRAHVLSPAVIVKTFKQVCKKEGKENRIANIGIVCSKERHTIFCNLEYIAKTNFIALFSALVGNTYIKY